MAGNLGSKSKKRIEQEKKNNVVKKAYGVISDFEIINGFSIVWRRGPEQLVTIGIRSGDDLVLRFGDDVGLFGRSSFWHRVRLFARPLTVTHLVFGREPERVNCLRLQILQDVRDI
jgi:hypothetical protein